MALRINFYRVERGDDLGDPEYWNRRFEDIDLRLGWAEEQLANVDAVANRVEQTALDRINNVITPLVVETKERLASIPDLFTASSASSVTVGNGTKSLVIDAIARDTWAVSNFLYVEAASDPEVWMTARLNSFDRVTGIVEIDVFDFNGSGTVAGWRFAVSGRRGPAGALGPVGLTFRGAYSAITAYEPRDVVRYDRSSWIAKAATTGNVPPALPATSNTWWEVLVERGADGQETGAFETDFSETVSGSAKTTFTITGGYAPAASMLVFLNGVKLAAEDYTATNGTTVVLDVAADVGDIFEFKAFSVFGIGAVLQVGQNLADLDSADTALVNLGGTSVGRDVFKATSQAAARTAIDAAAASHGHAISEITNLSTQLSGRTEKTQNLNDLSDKAVAFANIKQAATTSATGVVELATTGEAIAGTDNTRAVTPAGLAAAASNFGPKAFVNFQGGSTPVIRSQRNVASVVRTGGGEFVISFATPMANANYVVSTTVSNPGGLQVAAAHIVSQTASALTILCVQANASFNTNFNADVICVTIFE